ncbi:phosphonate ABC transporter substrate-binding protein [Vulcanibacillus modesticaldus]|uniref:Phosphonate ABC transporter substrate-binding protein n=1 Tax=Vulcanibacillus modesticaldus TaxID=337097 RepID=A0A1D2YV38_9BACI|nr:phosphate/phosphite/phosphonate ABC transporter substrate-binding protein [Vulcanibacillus modesticaldus]OEF99569.1 phosphonate ABC transporter substrate-binding protein [Vulcanibacillus modesticaldus]
MKHLFSFKNMLLAIFLVILIFSLTACGNNLDNDNSSEQNAVNEKPFKVGVIPAQNKGNMERAMDKLENVLAKALDRPVEINIYSDYQGVVLAMKYNKIDMAYLGPLTYVQVNNDTGAQAIVTQLINGEPFYYSYIIVPKDSPLNSIDDLVARSKELNFAFGDINSTSGSLIPSIQFKKLGVYIDQENHKFKNITFTGSHDITALAIQNKKYDAGAIDSAIFNQLVKDGKIDGEKIKVIWKSEKLFQYPWAVVKQTDSETIKKVQNAFLSIKDPDILDVFGATGFTLAKDSDYDAIRKAAKETGRLD